MKIFKLLLILALLGGIVRADDNPLVEKPLIVLQGNFIRLSQKTYTVWIRRDAILSVKACDKSPEEHCVYARLFITTKEFSDDRGLAVSSPQNRTYIYIFSTYADALAAANEIMKGL